mmetsp:Transcript_4796/g.16725  ORF Transcript_4796/g.16725 Transcript_4796/m.16725 type:complete len:331 (+) Transcript_4796:220-1212(+)
MPGADAPGGRRQRRRLHTPERGPGRGRGGAAIRQAAGRHGGDTAGGRGRVGAGDAEAGPRGGAQGLGGEAGVRDGRVRLRGAQAGVADARARRQHGAHAGARGPLLRRGGRGLSGALFIPRILLLARLRGAALPRLDVELLLEEPPHLLPGRHTLAGEQVLVEVHVAVGLLVAVQQPQLLRLPEHLPCLQGRHVEQRRSLLLADARRGRAARRERLQHRLRRRRRRGEPRARRLATVLRPLQRQDPAVERAQRHGQPHPLEQPGRGQQVVRRHERRAARPVPQAVHVGQRQRAPVQLQGLDHEVCELPRELLVVQPRRAGRLARHGAGDP